VRKPWFGPKRYGIGVRPQTWQGWLVTLAFAVAVIAATMIAASR
jgi:hypothetical protein